MLYAIHSERLLCAQMDYNLLFRWFASLSVDETVWDRSSFTRNRDRLIAARVASKLLQCIVRKARAAHLLPNEHFSVDGSADRAVGGHQEHASARRKRRTA